MNLYLDSSLEEKEDIQEESFDNEPIDPTNRKLFISRQDKALKDIYRMIIEDEIDLNPEFQREHVWPKRTASLFIESLMMNIPIPSIFVAETKDQRWEVVDGQQRLTAIKDFYSNNLELKGLKVLNKFEKSTYEKLGENPEEKRALDNRTLNIIIVGFESSKDIKFDIFMRINQGSVQLNEQELRGCLYLGTLLTTIRKLKINDRLISIIGRRASFTKRRHDEELISRFFSMGAVINKENWSLIEGKYNGRLVKNINDYYEVNQHIDDEKQEKLQQEFTKSIENVYQVFGANSFRQYDTDTKEFLSAINRSVAELQLIVLSKFDTQEIIEKKEDLLQSFKNISEDKQFQNSVINATNNTSNVNYRYSKWGILVDGIFDR